MVVYSYSWLRLTMSSYTLFFSPVKVCQFSCHFSSTIATGVKSCQILSSRLDSFLFMASCGFDSRASIPMIWCQPFIRPNGVTSTIWLWFWLSLHFLALVSCPGLNLREWNLIKHLELVLMSPYSDPFKFEVRFGSCFQVDDIISLVIASLLMVMIQVVCDLDCFDLTNSVI